MTNASNELRVIKISQLVSIVLGMWFAALFGCIFNLIDISTMFSAVWFSFWVLICARIYSFKQTIK